MGKLKSWTCKDCINKEFRIAPQGEVAEYCALYKGDKRPRHEWVTDDFVDCLDKRTK